MLITCKKSGILEILPVVQLVAAVFHGLVSVVVLLVAKLFFMGSVPMTALFFPLVILPLLILILGLSWALASLGVFARDVGQTIGLITSVMLFMSPVFFPVESLPASLQPWMRLNPLTFIIEQVRAVLVWGHEPHWSGFTCLLLRWPLHGWVLHGSKNTQGFCRCPLIRRALRLWLSVSTRCTSAFKSTRRPGNDCGSLFCHVFGVVGISPFITTVNFGRW